MKTINVGISDLNVATPPNLIKTSGLGSCVGIILYDKINKVGGISHIMLPDSQSIANNKNKAKFPDTALPILIEKMLLLGADKLNIQAAIFGGAKMFDFDTKNSLMNIGERNVKHTIQVLKKLRIKIIHNHTGGNNGRTITLDCETGSVVIRTVSIGNETIFM